MRIRQRSVLDADLPNEYPEWKPRQRGGRIQPQERSVGKYCRDMRQSHIPVICHFVADITLEIMITDQMLDHVVERLSDSAFCKGRWNSPYAEIQDDFQSLFVSVCVDERTVDAATKNDIANLLVSTVPAGGEPTIGNWMVVFENEGEVIDSWAPYDL
jgi:hypothetical protein